MPTVQPTCRTSVTGANPQTAILHQFRLLIIASTKSHTCVKNENLFIFHLILWQNRLIFGIFPKNQQISEFRKMFRKFSSENFSSEFYIFRNSDRNSGMIPITVGISERKFSELKSEGATEPKRIHRNPA